ITSLDSFTLSLPDALPISDQDAFAVRSQEKAVAAQANGRLAREITPVTIPQRKGDPIIIDKDEHPRAGTTQETLAKLGTPFRKEDRKSTRLNSSHVKISYA